MSYIRIFSRRRNILALVILRAFLVLKVLLTLLTTLKIFLIILKAGITRLAAFLDLITAAKAITKYVRV